MLGIALENRLVDMVFSSPLENTLTFIVDELESCKQPNPYIPQFRL